MVSITGRLDMAEKPCMAVIEVSSKYWSIQYYCNGWNVQFITWSAPPIGVESNTQGLESKPHS